MQNKNTNNKQGLMSDNQKKKRKIVVATGHDAAEFTSLYQEEKQKHVKTTKRDMLAMSIHMKKANTTRILKSLEKIDKIPENWQVEFAEAKAECLKTIKLCEAEERKQEECKDKTFGEESLDLMRKLAPHVDYPRLESFSVEQLQQLAEILDLGLDNKTICYFLNKKIDSFGGFFIVIEHQPEIPANWTEKRSGMALTLNYAHPPALGLWTPPPLDRAWNDVKCHIQDISMKDLNDQQQKVRTRA